MHIKYLFLLIVVSLSLVAQEGFSGTTFNTAETAFKTPDGVELKAYLTIPEQANQKRQPAVLILEGSGKSMRTAEQQGNPFRAVAEALAENGYISLRFNKRGSGYNSNNGDYATATLLTNYNDAKAALQYLRQRPEVDQARIFVFGHSMGGPNATMLAGEDKAIKGIVLLASPAFSPSGFTFIDYNNEQLGYLHKYGSHKSDQEVALELEKNRKLLTSIKAGSLDCSDYDDFFNPVCSTQNGKQLVYGSVLEYWTEVLNYDQIAMLKKVTCQVLLINGTSDFVVTEKNGILSSNALREVATPYKAVVIQKLDHYFAENESKEASVAYMSQLSVGAIELKPVHPELLKSLFTWLKEIDGT